ncbi:DUF2273 domain-containing protein [Serinibacter arcticus]|uniref:DUF2273 domain-containing protein n=1 Tax=Serinibacter arcticus TaxID=1655435 RepID=A0A2U1ZWJ1_9MICO|nr:DUF2273 domain-containing protein [Serinibacter arcticus]PWD51334.1 DUF2273 domain-containing protein [Serinibacter arcticus]
MDLMRTGLFAGLLLALSATVGGFGGFLLALVLGAIGLAVGAVLEGRLDLGALTGNRRRG